MTTWCDVGWKGTLPGARLPAGWRVPDFHYVPDDSVVDVTGIVWGLRAGHSDERPPTFGAELARLEREVQKASGTRKAQRARNHLDRSGVF